MSRAAHEIRQENAAGRDEFFELFDCAAIPGAGTIDILATGEINIIDDDIETLLA